MSELTLCNAMSRVATIELIFGPMFSGKTTEAIRRVRKLRAARASVLVFKHAKDTRYTGRAELLSSHDETKLDAIPVTNVAAIRERVAAEPKHVDCVCIEEAQFLAMPYVTPMARVATHMTDFVFDMGSPDPSGVLQDLVELVLSLRNAGTSVILAGLDTDKHRRLWPWVAPLLAHADSVDKLSAVCRDCREDRAIYSRCTTTNASIDDPGGAESYVALCPGCWARRDEPADSREHLTSRAYAPREGEHYVWDRVRPVINALVRRVKAAPWFTAPSDDVDLFDLCWDAFKFSAWDDEAAFREVEREMREAKT